MEKLRVLSLFSGIGAFEEALKNIGMDYELVNYCEIDKYASKSYCAIHGVNDNLNLGDIAKIDKVLLPKNIDMITHGSPCTNFSVAGRQEGGDENSNTQSSLMWNTVKIVKHCMPKYVIWENVKNVLSKKHKHNFDKYIEILESLGYKSYWKVLNAKDFGVPQNRERIFVVSILGEHEPYDFPKGFELTKCIKDILEDEVDEKYYMDKPFKLVNKGHQAELDMKGQDCIKRVYGINKIAPTLTTMQGGHREPKILETGAIRGRYNSDGKIEQHLEIRKDGLTNTLTTVQKDNVIINYTQSYRVRKLTPLECWRLMGFTDEDFYKAKEAGISNSQLYKQAGNSIVVNVLEEIFKNLF